MRTASLILNRGTEHWSNSGVGFGVWVDPWFGIRALFVMFSFVASTGNQQCLDVRRRGREIWL